MYYIAKEKGVIIGARKVLTNFQLYKHIRQYNRFNQHINFDKKVCYLQAIAVLKEYRNKGVGSAILNRKIKDIPIQTQIFGSIMESNTIQKKYINEHHFIVIGNKDNRILI